MSHSCLRIEEGMLRHGLLFLIVISFLVAGCQKSGLSDHALAGKIADVSGLVTAQDWKSIVKIGEKTKDPLLLLASDYANFQLEAFDKVLKSAEIKEKEFKPYQIYLKAMAAFQSRNYELASTFKIPNDLPKTLTGRLQLNRAQSFKEIKNLDEARKLLIQFLAETKQVQLKGDAILLLADIEWQLNFKEDALKRYRTLYESFPLTDTEDQAVNRLSEGGKFSEIDLETHISRIQKLQRAAQFSRASDQIKKLLQSAPGLQQEKILLADAQLSFAMRDYGRSFKLSKNSLQKKLALEQEIDWRNLLAWSLIRLGRSDEGQEEYKKLLKMKIPEKDRETILLRLGASATDGKQYDVAMKLFKELREKFPKGRYQESAHWYEAWALYQQGIKESPINEGLLRQSLRLLSKLPNLPDGANLEPQSLYWRSQIHRTLQEHEREKYEISKLEFKWKFSYYNLLSRDQPFQFLREMKIRSPEKMSFENIETVHFESKMAWRRLEAFRGMHLMEWARLELESFLESVQNRNSNFKSAVAKRLRDIEDWPDLVKWTENNFEKDLEGATENSDYLQFLYPRAHEIAVMAASKEFDVSPYLIWGIMREESRFEVEIRSRAGAEGLMQLMPHLAKRIGRNLGDRSPYAGWMFDAKRNIRFGTFHLRELDDQVDDIPGSEALKTVLMIASYNAGIDPVKRWVKEQDTTRVDAFVESIPYTETKGYVKRVLQTAYIYHRLYGPIQKKEKI